MSLLKNKVFLGIMCILLAAVVAFVLLPRFYSSQSKTVHVVRVSQNVPHGTEITKSMLTTSEVGAYGLSDKVITDEDEAVGMIAFENLYAGEYLWSERVMNREEYAEKAETEIKGLTEGNCLVTLAFPSASTGVAGVLRAGNLVDVYECRQNEDRNYVSEKRFSALYVYELLNKDLESLNELDEKLSKVVDEDVKYDFEPAYIVFRCTQEQAQTLIRLEKEKTLHLTYVGTEVK